MIAIKNATLVMKDHLIPEAVLMIEDGVIQDFGEMRSTSIPAELWEKTIYKYDDIKLLFWHESAGAEVGGWKNHEKTKTLTEAFRNWDYVEEFTSWDNISYTDTDNLY